MSLENVWKLYMKTGNKACWFLGEPNVKFQRDHKGTNLDILWSPGGFNNILGCYFSLLQWFKSPTVSLERWFKFKFKFKLHNTFMFFSVFLQNSYKIQLKMFLFLKNHTLTKFNERKILILNQTRKMQGKP